VGACGAVCLLFLEVIFVSLTCQSEENKSGKKLSLFKNSQNLLTFIKKYDIIFIEKK
jgi:hypothetical protein